MSKECNLSKECKCLICKMSDLMAKKTGFCGWRVKLFKILRPGRIYPKVLGEKEPKMRLKPKAIEVDSKNENLPFSTLKQVFEHIEKINRERERKKLQEVHKIVIEFVYE